MLRQSQLRNFTRVRNPRTETTISRSPHSVCLIGFDTKVQVLEGGQLADRVGMELQKHEPGDWKRGIRNRLYGEPRHIRVEQQRFEADDGVPLQLAFRLRQALVEQLCRLGCALPFQKFPGPPRSCSRSAL